MSTTVPTCPCCNNPWAAATGEFFAKLCETCENTADNNKDGVSGLNRLNMDFNILPSQNFYQYASGTWMKNNPIPSGYPSWNTFTALHVQSQEQLKELLDELVTKSKEQQEVSTNEMKVAAFYSAALDEDTVEKNGITGLKCILDFIDEMTNGNENNNKEVILGKLAYEYSLFPFFTLSASPDNKESDHTLCQIAQGGIGLPDRDYYFDTDKQDKRDAYKEHISSMLSFLYNNNKEEIDLDKISEDIYKIEEQLATAHMTKTENRDPEATYNKMSIEQLNNTCDNKFDFASYLNGATNSKDLGEINVRNVVAIQKMASVFSELDNATLKYFLQWYTINSLAPYLSKDIVQTDFNFYETILKGVSEMKPRWKRSMEFVENALGEVLGQLYCAKYFDETSKVRAKTIVEAVRVALEERLNEVDWMKAETTRQSALEKMNNFKVKIGYPDKWIDYTPLIIDSTTDTFLDMVLKARAFNYQYKTVKEMNEPTDRTKWYMTPQTVNAYYHPSLNEIVFPVAILQPPFFTKDADDAVNFGAMGAVVGHEMTHGFDDKGRKFNANGNMIDWWTTEDATEYEQRVEVMVQQANEFQVYGQSVQGKLTCGENIADLGGLRLALRALKGQDKYDETYKIDGFTPIQRFFLSWGQCWRQNVTKDRALQLLTIDPHGPNEMRCNGPLSNISEFHTAFNVKDGDPMYRPVETRVDIW